MKVEIHKIDYEKDEELKYAVIIAKLNDKFVYVKHKERETWEIPGGHRELNEAIDDTANRELREETGAKKFKIKSICDYSVERNNKLSFGRVYYAEIEELGELPDLEIGEIRLFETIPKKLTYPEIQPILYKAVISNKERNF